MFDDAHTGIRDFRPDGIFERKKGGTCYEKK